MRRVLGLLLFIALLSTLRFDNSSVGQDAADTGSASPNDFSVQKIEEQLEGSIDAEAIVAASSWVNSTGIVDWLGPLAPVALSPFFGVTCLSGLAMWGPDWVTGNAVLGAQGPLRSELLFAVFLLLTMLTSLPRLTKVSKPFAQAVDRLETYAVIVILLVIKIEASMESGGEEQVALVQFGIVSVTLDTLLAITMVINILVINSVKFFFEFMVWLTPVPLLDAVFEVCNKSLCFALMAVYAFSPTVATMINLFMMILAAIMLRWISRRVHFYRSMILDPVIARFWRGFGSPKRPELIVFPTQDIGPFKAKSRLRLRAEAEPQDHQAQDRQPQDHQAQDRQAQDRQAQGNLAEPRGWLLEDVSWWMPSKSHVLASNEAPQVRCGWVTNCVSVTDVDGLQTMFSFSRRYNAGTLEQLVEQLGMRISDKSAPDGDLRETIQKGLDKVAGEFA